MVQAFDLFFSESAKILNELGGESDRAAAILAVSILDESLTNLIKSRLRKGSESTKALFKHPGPLSDYFTKASVGYSMCLYEKNIYEGLKIAGEIRNQFGHFAKPMTFETRSISDKCKTLYERIDVPAITGFSKEQIRNSISDEKNYRHTFRTCFMLLYIEMHRRLESSPNISL